MTSTARVSLYAAEQSAEVVSRNGVVTLRFGQESAFRVGALQVGSACLQAQPLARRGF
jgi:hypothetical protein